MRNIVKEWIQNMRNDNNRTNGSIGDGSGNYCAVGKLMEVADPEGWTSKNPTWSGQSSSMDEATWSRLTGLPADFQHIIIRANDHGGDWDAIADVIEALAEWQDQQDAILAEAVESATFMDQVNATKAPMIGLTPMEVAARALMRAQDDQDQAEPYDWATEIPDLIQKNS